MRALQDVIAKDEGVGGEIRSSPHAPVHSTIVEGYICLGPVFGRGCLASGNNRFLDAVEKVTGLVLCNVVYLSDGGGPRSNVRYCHTPPIRQK
jgi:hypothetical protein